MQTAASQALRQAKGEGVQGLPLEGGRPHLYALLLGVGAGTDGAGTSETPPEKQEGSQS